MNNTTDNSKTSHRQPAKNKSITIGAKPRPINADEWVSGLRPGNDPGNNEINTVKVESAKEGETRIGEPIIEQAKAELSSQTIIERDTVIDAPSDSPELQSHSILPPTTNPQKIKSKTQQPSRETLSTQPQVAPPIPTSTLALENPVTHQQPQLMKRLTLDIPEELHARIKSQCALRRTKMVDDIRALLEEKFPVS